jgi:hypothetical protein
VEIVGIDEHAGWSGTGRSRESAVPYREAFAQARSAQNRRFCVSVMPPGPTQQQKTSRIALYAVIGANGDSAFGEGNSLSADDLGIRVLRALAAFREWSGYNPAEWALAEAAKEFGIEEPLLKDYLLRQLLAADAARREIALGTGRAT